MKLAASSAELHSASQAAYRFATDYSGIYSRIAGIARTMGEIWKTADNLAFVERINEFCDDLQALARHFENLGYNLEGFAHNYELVNGKIKSPVRGYWRVRVSDVASSQITNEQILSMASQLKNDVHELQQVLSDSKALVDRIGQTSKETRDIYDSFAAKFYQRYRDILDEYAKFLRKSVVEQLPK